MNPLYPVIKPYKTHELAVSEPHVLYIEEVGNPEGIPVMILHSGPGAGGDPQLRRFFDPQFYRMVLFDQRGCGRSTPYASLENNTTQAIIEDIEKIRKFLGIHRFILFGGGFGALLALLYAQLYPQQVSALLLYQIFLARMQDINWFFYKGANLFFPDYWQEFITHFTADALEPIPQYYAKCLQGNNDLVRMSAAKNWALWEARCSSLQPHLALIEQYSEPHFALALATLETHFINNHFFIEENQVIINAPKIREIQTFLIHGRYDMLCPIKGAWDLHQVLPTSVLRIIRDAGHSFLEPGIIDAIIDVSKLLSRQNLNAS